MTGVVVRPEAATEAMARGAIRQVVPSIAAFGPVDLVLVAVPPSQTVASVNAALATGVPLVTDVASVKTPVVARVADPRFVGGHPIAGSETSGPGSARADRFRYRRWVLTPRRPFSPDNVARLRELITSLGAHAIEMDTVQHDQAMAMVSHGPHLAVAGVAGCFAENLAMELASRE